MSKSSKKLLKRIARALELQADISASALEKTEALIAEERQSIKDEEQAFEESIMFQDWEGQFDV